MAASDFLLFKGVLHGIYVAAVVLMLLFGFSYRNESHNWRILVAHILFAICFACFGLYNAFFLATHGMGEPIYSGWVLVACAMAAPLAVLVAHYIFVSALAIRSYRVYDFLYRFRWGNYIICAVSIAIFFAIPFISDFAVISNLILLGFLVPLLGGLVLSVVSIEPNKPESNVIGNYFTIIFATMLLATAYSAYLNFTQVLYEDVALLLTTGAGFAFVVLMVGFVSLRYGITEMNHFFFISHLNHFEVLGDLSKAISNEQFSLLYQPQADLNTGDILGVEALLRWNHPTKGMMNPGDFFLLAESTGLFDTITRWVTEHALQDLKKLHAAGHCIGMSINFSPSNMRVAQLEHLVATLAKLDIAQHHLTIELTENVMLKHGDKHIQQSLAFLSGTDIALSLDDFGTGFSSLGYLRDLSVDELKIDASFVRNLCGSDQEQGIGDGEKGKSRAIVQAMVQIAKSLGIQTIAEGIEHVEQIDALRALGCGAMQGYLLARPIPVDELLMWLQNHPDMGKFT